MSLKPNEAKLITLGMNIQRRENKLTKQWLTEFEKWLFEKERIKAENDYFDFRFEMNREDLENKYIVKRIEDWIDEQDVIEEVMTWFHKFIEFCWEKCFQNIYSLSY